MKVNDRVPLDLVQIRQSGRVGYGAAIGSLQDDFQNYLQMN